MKFIFKSIVPLFTVIGFILLASACNAKDVSAQNEVKNDKSYRRTVKPHAPVFMAYQLPKLIEVNQPIVIDISVTSGRDVAGLAVELRAGKGLQTADVLNQQFATQHSGQKNTFQFTVQAAEEGRYRVYVTASLISGKTIQSRSFIIPVNIGKLTAAPKLKAMGVVVEDEVGEKIISMPATETP